MRIVKAIISSLLIIHLSAKDAVTENDYVVINSLLREVNVFDKIYFQENTINKNIGYLSLHTDTILDKYINQSEQEELIFDYQKCNKETFKVNVNKIVIYQVVIIPYDSINSVEANSIEDSKPIIGISKPIYDKSGNYSIIYLETKYKSNLRGEGIIYHLYKEGDKWGIVSKVHVWVR